MHHDRNGKGKPVFAGNSKCCIDLARPRRSVLQRQGQEAMNQQRRRPRAIAIARAEKSRGQNELTAYLATLALFAVTAVALFSWL
ncbi:hypothetical protein SM0020_07437 [Sinorhizobium meliloti CCNWSX0020]|nr:hypothetical protein SM0020_07437 [Sinorhizobium meliloti CCNWSX0020]